MSGINILFKNGVIILTFITLLTQIILAVIKAYYTSWLGRSIHQYFTTKIGKKFLCSSYREMITKPSGEITVALGDESYGLGQTVIYLSEVISNLMLVIFYLVAIVFLSIRFAVFLIVTICLIGFITLFMIRLGKQFGDNLVLQSKKIYSVVFDLINNMKAIRLFNNEKNEIDKYEEIFSKYRKFHIMRDLFQELTSLIPQFILYVILLGMYFFYFENPVNVQSINVSVVLLLFGYSSRVLIGSKNIALKLGNVISTAQAGQDVFDILELPNDEFGSGKPGIIPDFGGEFRFEKINFIHKGQSQPLFTDLDLSIPFGKHVAIVGETGSGKSTLLDLYVSLLEPNGGKRLVSGHDLVHVNRRIWRSKVVYVNQEISLFNDTILNNLSYGINEIPFEKVVYYSKLARCHDFIIALPDGYNTQLHYQAKNISGGQKQRLLIAHALIFEPEVLILDESTNSLDEYTQGIILQNIKNLYRDKTLIIVTHKSEMLPLFDHIIRLDKGTVAYEGNFKGYHDLYSPKVSS